MQLKWKGCLWNRTYFSEPKSRKMQSKYGFASSETCHLLLPGELQRLWTLRSGHIELQSFLRSLGNRFLQALNLCCIKKQPKQAKLQRLWSKNWPHGLRKDCLLVFWNRWRAQVQKKTVKIAKPCRGYGARPGHIKIVIPLADVIMEFTKVPPDA